MKREELIERLQYAIKDIYDINVTIIFIKEKIYINGVFSKIDELKIYLFIQGFLYALNNKDSKLQIYNPEAS